MSVCNIAEPITYNSKYELIIYNDLHTYPLCYLHRAIFGVVV